MRLSSLDKALGRTLNQPAMIAQVSTWEVGAVGPRMQGHPWLIRKFKASLGYMKFLSQNQNNSPFTSPKNLKDLFVRIFLNP